jgi:signal transduction histidine kinase
VLPLLAAAVVAVVFQPARDRVQRWVDRWVYGDRVSPYEVLSAFSAEIGTTFETGEQLTQMARLLAHGTGARRAEVLLTVGGQQRSGAVWPPDAADAEPDLTIPVVHHGEQLGMLAITKDRSDAVTPQDHKLVVDLAAQAGIALRNVGLTAELLDRVDELRASRQRLVSAQDEERRRIERDLHDGAQQQLVALKIKLGLAQMQAEEESAPQTARMLGDLTAEAGEALSTLRDLAHGIYPPLLAAEGLVPALQAQARRASVPVEVVADAPTRFDPEVEIAAYYCCLEALQNITKYADASTVRIEVHHDGEQLALAVVDDGRGFEPGEARGGAGLRNMVDRVDALAGTITIESRPGAGTAVRARIPATLPS